MSKPAPPPQVSAESWRALFAAATDYAALRPWVFASDSDSVGLLDPVTGETRIGHVLGNAGEVFAAVFYRRVGVRWIVSMLNDPSGPEDLNNAGSIDALKFEFVHKRDLWKEDIAHLKAAGFKPAGKGPVWPQIRSSEPGWLPWHINQAEADQLLVDLPCLTAFCKLFEQHPGLFANRPATDIPFLPATLPKRPLTLKDLDWRPIIPLGPAGFEPFQAPSELLDKIRALKRSPGLECEFNNTLIPGGSFYERGRPCLARVSLLVESKGGIVMGIDIQKGSIPPGEAAVRGLCEALRKAKVLPENLFISGSNLQPALQPLCDELHIQLRLAPSLPALEEAVESLTNHMLATSRQHGRL